jgi:glycosyltransferase involved in cell wall biosynthesis
VRAGQAAADPGAPWKVRTDGKFFALGGDRFSFRGVTYGTFGAREDGALFPDREQVKRDFAAMREAGFTVVRTYTSPPDDVVELAADWDLRLLVGVFYPDWRYLLGRSRRDQRRVAAEARATVRASAAHFAGVEHVLALSLGNEVPADVIRWVGTTRVAHVIEDLAEIVREEDPDQLVTYANYPTAEYLPLENLDFLTFNVFLERQPDFRRYLTRLHHLAGDRPLILGEIGLDAGNDGAGSPGELHQAEVLDWQLATALERGVAGTCLFSWTDEWSVAGQRVEGWHFGLTHSDRSPRPSLTVAAHWNGTTVADLEYPWPSISVVICAYNAAATLDECLRRTAALDYPSLDLLVVDDGSTDDTAAIARRYDNVRLVTIEHAGLSTARNAGLAAARGALVAYLDADAYPSREWPYFLALGMDSATVGGVGGPNVPPKDDPRGAHQVARAPGGPVHVLLSDDRAEHVPGCNMAFWKPVLAEVGGFDPIYTAAGDDVDLCWKVLDRGWEIAFHPAALVWHHRRPGLRAYLRQQRGYGKAEALVEARHPDRFTPFGTARWRGSIYDSFTPRRVRGRVYRGLYGAASYQSVYRSGGHALDIAHQVGVPVAVLGLASAPFATVRPAFGMPAVLAATVLVFLGLIDASHTRPPGGVTRRIRFRFGVATLHLFQPIVRTWGRMREARSARRLPRSATLAVPVRRIGRNVWLFAANGPRAELAAALVSRLRSVGLRAVSATGWESFDARLLGSLLLYGDLVSSSHPDGCVQVTMVRRPRLVRALAVGVLIGAAAQLSMPVGLFLGAVALADLARGLWRTGPRFLGRTIGRWSPEAVE